MPQRRNLFAESPRMTRGEIVFGWIYLVFYLFLTPLLIQLVLELARIRYDVYELNLIYFYVNFIAVVLFCRKFLMESFRQTRVLPLLHGILTGYGINWLLALAVTGISMSISDYVNPADAATTEMILGNKSLMTVCAVFLGPLVEEILVRGLIFAPLARRKRWLGYLVSTVVFSALHLLGYIGTVPVDELLLSLLDYVPSSIALAYAYERGGTIWSPIALHMLINAMSVMAIGAMGTLT